MDIQEHYFLLLQDILRKRTFEHLEKFKDGSLQEKMSQKEKELLSDLFALQMGVITQDDDQYLTEVIDLCAKVDLLNPEVFYRQGIAWLNFGKNHRNEAALHVACKKFKKAILLSPSSGKCHLALANTFALLGSVLSDPSLFLEAEGHFQKAQLFFGESLEKLFQLQWDFGLMHFLSGKLSGEVVDFRKSVERFHDAYCILARMSENTKSNIFEGSPSGDRLLKYNDCLFWEDYGCALVEMAILLSSKDLFLKAVHFFEFATEANRNRYESWVHLATTYHSLFEMTGGETYFDSAVDAYQKAAELNDNDAEIWVKWGQLLVSSGKLDLDIEAIERSLEKFVNAEECHPNHPMVYSGWGEALMLLGVFKEDLAQLKDAEEKIVKGLELSPENADIWGSYGACLFEIGRYFQDEKYYLQAVQKFQYGLSLNTSLPGLWLGISQAYFALSELKRDLKYAEQAVFAASRATSLRSMLPQLWINHAGALLQMAELADQSQYVENAIDKLEIALNLSKDLDEQLYLECLFHYGSAWDFLADFELDSMAYEKAVSVLTQVVTKEPEYFQARHSLAVALLHLGEVTDDIDCFLQAIDHFAILVNIDAEDALLWNDWGIALLDLAYLKEGTGRPDEFISYLDEAEIKLRSSIALGSVHAYYYLACLYSMKHQYELAIHYIGKAENQGVLPSLDDLLHDEWLSSLRKTEYFQQFIQQLKIKPIN